MMEKDIRELLQAITNQTRKQYAECFRDLNLHVGQETALCHLWEKDGISQTELRTLMGCEASTLSNMLKTLEQDKVVRREKDPNDGRSTNVFLTDKGRALKAPIQQIWQEQQDKLLKGIISEELMLTRRILQHMLGNIQNDN